MLIRTIPAASFAILASYVPLPAQPARPAPMPPSSAQVAMLKDVGIDQKLNAQIPLDLRFHNERGETVPLGKYFGAKPVILALVYYQCPMLCNLTLNGLEHTLQSLTLNPVKDYEFVAVSIDPLENPPLAMAKKETYLEKFQRPGAIEGWHFLTGKEPAIHALADAVGFHFKYDTGLKQYAHAAGIMVSTPEGKLSRYFYGIQFPERDLRFSLMEASNNRIGSPVDRILLYCYHYDPVSGKYGVAITRLLQVLGSATALLLGAFVFINIRRDLRHASAESGRLV